MKIKSGTSFFCKIYNKNESFPLSGHIDLTYRCNLNCVHCYCSGLEDKNKELNTREWKEIIDQVCKEGCISLSFSGGDPFVREDFLELFSYAQKKGLFVVIYTNGLLLSEKIIGNLAKYSLLEMEITLNGITKETYEKVTRVRDSFSRVMNNIRLLLKRKITLQLKTNCLTLNKHEVAKIKSFAKKTILGNNKHNIHYFKYDPCIYPRLNGNKGPINFRLSFNEIQKIRKEDIDFWQEYKKSLHGEILELTTNKDCLYRCSVWKNHFFIDPYGKMKFCIFTERFSTDLRIDSFRKGFYEVFPLVSKEKFKTNSKCRNCSLRAECNWCPPKAYLETGSEEAPVRYYCDLAKAFSEESKEESKTAKFLKIYSNK